MIERKFQKCQANWRPPPTQTAPPPGGKAARYAASAGAGQGLRQTGSALPGWQWAAHIAMHVAVHPAEQRLRAAVFDYRPFTHFAAPRSVGHLCRRVCPLVLRFVQRHLLIAVLDAAVIALLESQPGRYFPQACDAGRPRGVWRPVASSSVFPPLGGIAGGVSGAIIANCWPVNDLKAFASVL